MGDIIQKSHFQMCLKCMILLKARACMYVKQKNRLLTYSSITAWFYATSRLETSSSILDVYFIITITHTVL
jgi:hypothetical protein